MVLAQNVQVVGVRAGVDGQVIAVVLPVKGNHAGTAPLVSAFHTIQKFMRFQGQLARHRG
jgi:hypothetical protein